MSFYENIDPYLNVESENKEHEAVDGDALESKEHDILSILTNQS